MKQQSLKFGGISEEILDKLKTIRASGEKQKAYGNVQVNFQAVTQISGILYKLVPGSLPSSTYSLTTLIVLKLVRLFSKGFDDKDFVVDNYVDAINYLLILAESHQKHIDQIHLEEE